MFEICLENSSSFLIFGIVFSLVYHVYTRRKYFSSLPPGPFQYPIVGNAFLLIGGDIRETFQQLRQQYGDIFCIRVFNRTVIVFNGYDILKDIFVKRGEEFSDRHTDTLSIETIKGQGVVETSGEIWKENRKVALQALREFGMGKNIIQERIYEELDAFLPEIEKQNGRPVSVFSLMTVAVSNIINSVVFGKRFDYNDKKFTEYIFRLNEMTSKAASLFFLPPFLKYIPGDPFSTKLFEQSAMKIMPFIEKLVDEHLQEFKEGKRYDVIDALIQHRSRASSKHPSQHRKDLIRHAFEFFTAGTETTASTLKWFILHLVRDRDLQSRLHNELKEVLNDDRRPFYSEKDKFPYLQATIEEVLRWAAIVPLGVVHAPSKDTTIGSYTIPKDAYLIMNLDSVLADKKLWSDSQAFRPSRHLDECGRFVQREEAIPFSTGRRKCLGEALARMELFLFSSALIQKFEFLPEEEGMVPPLDGILGVTHTPKDFRIRAVRRTDN